MGERSHPRARRPPGHPSGTICPQIKMMLTPWFVDSDDLPTRVLLGVEADEAAKGDAAGREVENS
jgi:hypothetical protein